VAAAEARAHGIRAGVVPTRSPVQGLAALAVRDPERRFEDDVIAMAEAAGACRYAEVTVAAREALTVAGRCQPGDVLALIEGEVNLIGHDLLHTSRHLLDRMLAGGGELVTLVTGEGAPSNLAEALSTHLAEHWPFAEVNCYEGGQPLYRLPGRHHPGPDAVGASLGGGHPGDGRDVTVVGQHHDPAGPGRLDRGEDLPGRRRTGQHRRALGGEQGSEPFARTHGDDRAAGPRSGALGPVLVFEVTLFEVVGGQLGAGLATAGGAAARVVAAGGPAGGVVACWLSAAGLVAAGWVAAAARRPAAAGLVTAGWHAAA
jgi:hypothetical protein